MGTKLEDSCFFFLFFYFFFFFYFFCLFAISRNSTAGGAEGWGAGLDSPRRIRRAARGVFCQRRNFARALEPCNFLEGFVGLAFNEGARRNTKLTKSSLYPKKTFKGNNIVAFVASRDAFVNQALEPLYEFYGTLSTLWLEAAESEGAEWETALRVASPHRRRNDRFAFFSGKIRGLAGAGKLFDSTLGFAGRGGELDSARGAGGPWRHRNKG